MRAAGWSEAVVEYIRDLEHAGHGESSLGGTSLGRRILYWPRRFYLRLWAADPRKNARGKPASNSLMPLPWKPEDRPGAVRFRLAEKDGALEVTVSQLPQIREKRYRVEGGAPRFANRDAFKARVIEMGFSPAVAEDTSRSFNATARQLRKLGFDVAIDADAP